MKRILSTLILGLWIAAGMAHAADWTYKDAENWGKHYKKCRAGGHQSPIDIHSKDVKPGDNNRIRFSFNDPAEDIVNNGHTIQVNFPWGRDTITIGAKKYYLMQFHFHSPAENLMDGKQYPIEMHFVSKSMKGKYAVVAVFFKEGAPNLAIAELWKHMPAQKDEKNSLDRANIAYDALLPKNKAYYAFEGSLTTPPCTHGIAWNVIEKPLTMSKEQIDTFRQYYPDNSRPVQPLNDRAITSNR